MEELRDDVLAGQDDRLGGLHLGDLGGERLDRLGADHLAGHVGALALQLAHAAVAVGAGMIEQLALDLRDALAVHHQGGGGEDLAGGDRPHGRLDAGCGVLDGQQHVVADRVLHVPVQAPDLGSILGRQRLLDQQHHVVGRRLAHAHSLALPDAPGAAQPPSTSARS